MEFQIHLKSVQDILAFVSLSTSRSFPITVGNQKHQVNAKSFLGLFCLNWKTPMTVTAECTPEEFAIFHQDAQRFVVV